MAAPPKFGYTQDMPPPGGYNSIQWERIKLKTFFTPRLTIGLYFASTLAGIIAYSMSYKKFKKEELEMRSARFAIFPMLLAERDRAFLKQMRKNVEEEKELMKNVPEWKLGTYFGEPVYITEPDKYHEPTYYEFMAHADWWDVTYRVLRRHLT